MNEGLLYAIFAAVVVAMMAFDLGVLNRRAHVIRVREAFLTSMMWIGISLIFNAGVFFWRGSTSGFEFFTGYLIEKALSVDNLFVFLVVFSYFKVAPEYQHRVLFWGILGALVLRGALIAVGAALIQQFEWMVYLFGAFLLYTAVKLWRQRDEGVDPEKNRIVNLFRRLFPVSDSFEGGKFFKRSHGKWSATPLLIVLIVIETTDLAFALDSIPAIFAITTDTFIVLSSNIFAILGLRALYFLVANLLGLFRYLKYGLALVLGFVGIKMVVSAADINIPILLSLLIIAAILTASILLSMIAARREPERNPT